MSWSNAVYVCICVCVDVHVPGMDVNKGGTNCNFCTQRLIILHSQIY